MDQELIEVGQEALADAMERKATAARRLPRIGEEVRVMHEVSYDAQGIGRVVNTGRPITQTIKQIYIGGRVQLSGGDSWDIVPNAGDEPWRTAPPRGGVQ